MGLVQIEQSELDLSARSVTTPRDRGRGRQAGGGETAEQEKVTELETEKAAEERAETEKAEAEAAKTTLEEQANRATLKETAWASWGRASSAKLGDHTKELLETQAGELSDADWDAELKEVEEIAKRQARRRQGRRHAADPARRRRKAAAGPERHLLAGGDRVKRTASPAAAAAPMAPVRHRALAGRRLAGGAFKPSK
jgi:hypothetical protein